MASVERSQFDCADFWAALYSREKLPVLMRAPSTAFLSQHELPRAHGAPRGGPTAGALHHDSVRPARPALGAGAISGACSCQRPWMIDDDSSRVPEITLALRMVVPFNILGLPSSDSRREPACRDRRSSNACRSPCQRPAAPLGHSERTEESGDRSAYWRAAAESASSIRLVVSTASKSAPVSCRNPEFRSSSSHRGSETPLTNHGDPLSASIMP